MYSIFLFSAEFCYGFKIKFNEAIYIKFFLKLMI